jgi:hypothetical protein
MAATQPSSRVLVGLLPDDEPLDPPPCILPERSEEDDMTPQDVDTELRSLMQYESRYRFFWLFSAWVMLALQSAQMFIVMSNMALGREVTMTPVVVSSVTFIFCVGALAIVYKWVLFPDASRWWVPQFVHDMAKKVAEATDRQKAA